MGTERLDRVGAGTACSMGVAAPRVFHHSTCSVNVVLQESSICRA